MNFQTEPFTMLAILKRFPIDVFDYYTEDVYARVLANVWLINFNDITVGG